MKPTAYEQKAELIIRSMVTIMGRASMKVDEIKHRRLAEKVKHAPRGRNDPRS